MIRLGYIILVSFLFFPCTFLLAQKNDTKQLDEMVQELFQIQEIPMNYEDFYEAMYQFYMHPIDLNTASKEEFQSLYILSPSEINAIVHHRQLIGKFESIFELQTVDGLSEQSVRKMIYFVKIENIKTWKEYLRPNHPDASTYFILRNSQVLQKSKGYRENEFLGNPQHLYSRFRTSISKKYSIGFTLEKDAGEQFWSKEAQKKGIDFFSWHVAFFKIGKLKSLVLGDYLLQFGQGLVLGAGFNFGKGAESIATVKRNNLGVRPYSSVLERGFFRGFASSYEILSRLEATIFASSLPNDANIQVIATAGNQPLDFEATSLINTGLHRSINELSKKNQLTETNLGANFSWLSAHKDLHIGYSHIFTHFDKAYQPDTSLSNLFYFRGQRNHCQSVDFSWYKNNFNLFGEAAISSSMGKGINIGFISSLSHSVDLAMVMRKFDKNFHSFYAKAFAENYLPNNEWGIYWGLKIKPSKPWLFTAYYDYFHFPWLKYRVDAPSSGFENLLRITYQPSKILVVYSQFRYLEKSRNNSSYNFYFNNPQPYQKTNYLVDLQFKPLEKLTLHSRVQTSTFKHSNSPRSGFYMMQEATFRFKLNAISFRYAIFDTDDFDTRQYVYEKDVLYAFSIPMIYGTGSRYYLLVHYKISRSIDMWLKYGYTHYHNQNEIGSGWDTIEGNKKSEFKIQIRWRFNKSIAEYE